MARDKGDPEDIFPAIVTRLIAQIAGLNAGNCFHCINPDAVPPTPGEFMYVVAPISGTFDQAMIEGGGIEQLTVDGGLLVKIHSPLMLDETNHDTILLNDTTKGLWIKAKQVIAALSNWSPGVVGSELTRDPLFPSRFDITKSHKRLGAIELYFNVLWDWDVS